MSDDTREVLMRLKRTLGREAKDWEGVSAREAEEADTREESIKSKERAWALRLAQGLIESELRRLGDADRQKKEPTLTRRCQSCNGVFDGPAKAVLVLCPECESHADRH